MGGGDGEGGRNSSPNPGRRGGSTGGGDAHAQERRYDEWYSADEGSVQPSDAYLHVPSLNVACESKLEAVVSLQPE